MPYFNKLLINRTFTFIILLNTIFFTGYVICKDPLAYLLQTEGFSLSDAYSITTTANILLASCALFFAFFIGRHIRTKHSLLLGVTLNMLALLIFNLHVKNYFLLGISFYILGGGLYFFNIVIFINRSFNCYTQRIKANYIYQIFTNLAAIIGFVIFLNFFNTKEIFKFSFFCELITFLLFSCVYKIIDDKHQDEENYFKFYLNLIILFLLIIFFINFKETSRIITIIMFVTAICILLYKDHKQQSSNYTYMIFTVILLTLPYWIANTLIFNIFFNFLKKDVGTIFQKSAEFLILIDPTINIIMGITLLFVQKNKSINPYKNLILSSFLMLLSFFPLLIGLSFGINKNKLDWFYPLLTLLFFSCSEFLLLTNISSVTKNLPVGNSDIEFISNGITRSCRAVANALGYYLISFSTKIASNTSKILSNLSLYSIMVVICLTSFILFLLFYKKCLRSRSLHPPLV